MMRRRILSYDEALGKAVALCSKCEQCSSDILKKLAGWGVSAQDSRNIIAKLEEMRFLDDERFAKAYAHDKLLFSGWGKMKIATGLWAKHIPKDTLTVALENLDPSEYSDTARRVMSSRVRLNPELLDSYESRTKLLRYGVGRGFEISLISGIISKLKSEREDE